MYKVGQIFESNYPPEAAIWCNKNGYFIKKQEDGSYIISELIVSEPTIEDKISILHANLVSMDYKTSKYVDGEYTAEEWAEIVAERAGIRRQIRELENGM